MQCPKCSANLPTAKIILKGIKDTAVYTANPLNGDGISIDVEYIPSRLLAIGGDG